MDKLFNNLKPNWKLSAKALQESLCITVRDQTNSLYAYTLIKVLTDSGSLNLQEAGLSCLTKLKL